MYCTNGGYGWQGSLPQTLTNVPAGDRNCDTCSRTAGTPRAAPCGSLPAVFGMLSIGGAGVPKSQISSTEPSNGEVGTAGMFHIGVTSLLRPGASAGWCTNAPIVRASVSVPTFATWWSPNA